MSKGMTMPALSWAAFVFMALALAAAGFAKVDFHSAASILADSVAVFTGLAGLCLHPPWTPAPEPPAPAGPAAPPAAKIEVTP
jgi:hypothetical protein